MAEPAKKQELAPAEPTVSARFTDMVISEFTSSVGDVTKFDEEQRRLAQHLFIKIDASLNTLEAKRASDNSKRDNAPIVWANINMQKLALDAMHRIELGLDALCPNHIHPIPYFNSRLKKYDLDLRIGYAGKDYYRRKVALEPPKDIRYELVYSTDNFIVRKKDQNNQEETYTYEITNPFERGEILGGFGYLIYDDPTKNKLVLVTKKDFERSEKAGNRDFWTKYPTEMRFKTIITRVTDRLQIDPKKVSASYAAVEEQEAVAVIEGEIDANANTGDIIDGTAVDVTGQSAGTTEGADTTEGNGGMTPEEIEAALKREKAEADAEKKQRRGPGF